MKKPAAILSSVLALASGGAGALYYALFRRPLAQTSGAMDLGGLRYDVEIIRDRWGIPHIYAHDAHDLFFAQGFVHAQDRLFQMEFWRRLGAGRLAEVLGPLAVDVDRWMRVLSLRRVAENEVALLNDRARELMEAYASGVNAFIDRGKLPIEFALLRYRPERWQTADSLTWIKFMDWTLSANWTAELTRAQLMSHLGAERTAQLDGPYPSGSPTVLSPDINWDQIGDGALSRSDAARRYTGPSAESGVGSNNWVVNASRAANGAPLLASDMHLSLELPSIWYENHLIGADYDIIGLSFAGLPGVVAGHNGHVAWSYTAGLADTQDLYVERLNPENRHEYEYQGKWYPAQVFREEIRVKGEASVVEEVVVTRHGPLVDGLVPDETREPVALCWSALEPAKMGELIFDICGVKNVTDFHATMARWTGPVQNVVYADVEGNIGFTLVGRVPLRVEGHDGQIPVPGWTGEYEWQGYIPYEHMPHVINPPEGMLVTANGKPAAGDYPYYLGQCWLPGFRAARITELLGEAQKHTVADFCRIQFDQHSTLARRVGRHLGRLESQVPELDTRLFEDWDGNLAPDSAAAAVYEVFVRRWLYNLFDGLVDRSPEARRLADRFVGKGPHPVLAATGYYGANGRALLAHLLDNPQSPLFAERSCDKLTLTSLREAVDFLKWRLEPRVSRWRWGDLHQLTYAHPLGQGKVLARLFSRGPYPVGGDETTIWAMSAFYHSLHNEGMVGPACRFVVDLGDLSRSCSLNAPGQSGQLGSKHYADRVQAWLNGDYHPMLYHRQDVVAQAKATLHLLPGTQSEAN